MDELSIAVIGMDGRFPGAPDIAAFWRNLTAGTCGIAHLDDAALDAAGVPAAVRATPGFVPAAANLDAIDRFDAEFFSIGAREAQALDPQHRLLLEGARNALESAGYDPTRQRGDVGVFFGTAISQYLLHNLMPQPDVMQSLGDDYTVFGNYASYACSRIAHKLDLRGPVLALDTACSSSLVAVHLACKSLLNFECDMALAGGVQVNLPQHSGYVHQPGAFRAPDGVCRSFDARAQGTVFGSGLGVVLLKRLDEARRDGDTILAVIRGSAVNNDGSDKLGFSAPGVDGQTQVIEKALAFAGVSADTISYVETHGTGTPLGDPIEIAALTAAYRADTDRTRYCAIGSVKPSIGHLETAAGVAGLIKAILALQHRQLPPSLHYETPNPEIDFAGSPFFVNAELRPWTTAPGMPRRAGVSSFGIGGSNAHVILEEHVEAAQPRRTRPQQLLLWSAKSAAALDDATSRLAAHLHAQPALPLADVAHTLQCGREAFEHRRMLVCDGRDAALAALDAHATVTAICGDEPATVAFMFPGQGAQHVDMALALYRHEPVFRDALRDCVRRLQPLLGLDLLEVLYPDDAHKAAHAALLDETRLTQPALFCVEYALAQQWQAWGVQPDCLLGHSVGEYVAACIAGVFTLDDALRLVALRGRLMQSLPAGAMLAVPLSETDVRALRTTGFDLAAVNGPNACVVSGPHAVIDAVAAELAERGIDAHRVRTSHAFHSSMMEPMLAEFAAAVGAVVRSAPTLRFASNVTGDWITAEQAQSVDYWVRHLRGTVRFADGVRRVLAEPGCVLLEVGPGQTLAAFARLQDTARAHAVISSLPHPREQRDAQAAVLQALGRLWLANVSIAWDRFAADEDRRRVPLPTYPYQRKRYWIDPPAAGHRAATASISDARLPLADWFHAPAWTMAPRALAVPSSPRRWLVFCDASGVAAALCAALRARGEHVIEAAAGAEYDADGERYTLRADSGEDHARLLADLAGAGLPHEIVHMWSIDPVDGDHARAHRLGFLSLLQLVQALGAQARLTLTVVTSGLADVAGSEPLEPLKAGVLGPARVIAQEYPQIACRQIDVLAHADAAAALLDELSNGPDGDARIALRNGHRWRLDHGALPLADTAARPLPWREQGVYLITGGLGGLGAAFAEYLARRYRAKLVLTSRQPLPPRSAWDALAAQQGAVGERIRCVRALEALGAEVLVVAVDVTDQAGMTAALAQARAQFGTVHGVMHAAGIPGGGMLQRRRAADAEAVLAPKIRGTQVLFDALGDAPLDVLVLHSSLFAVTGGAGQADYCGANNALDLYAQAAARRGVRAVAINWDGWRDVGMAARAGVFPPGDDSGIAPHEGIDALDRVLAQTRLAQVVVSTRDLAAAMRAVEPQPSAHPLQQHERPALAAVYVPPQDGAETHLVRIWQDVLGLRNVGIHDNFFDLGGTSLLLSEVLQRIHRELDAAIGITELFQFPTIHALAARLAGADTGAADVDAVVELGNRRREAMQRKRRRPTPA